LANLRVADQDAAIELLEEGFDTAVLTLGPLDDAVAQSALGQAKLYRSLYPSEDPAVREALEGIEAPSLESCRPELRKLLETRRAPGSQDLR
ncbi:MAG: hypothetical protein AAF725_16375, partial [Acidobacteriota bacterium]